jgi:hypothetical protein
MLRTKLPVAALVCSALFLAACAGKLPPRPQPLIPAQTVEPVKTPEALSVPNQIPALPPAEKPVTAEAGPVFDPASVTVEEKNVAFTDIRALIENLNRIIQRKDFEAWRSNLTDEFIAWYSDPAVLDQISQYPVLKRTGIKLTSLKDYFLYVVYPSRQNDRVDDIDFVGERQVKAMTISDKGDRQILYSLEKHDDTWKIGIGR